MESFDKELYALGAVISVVEFGFYAGNIYGAVGSAHKYNKLQDAAFIDNLKLKFNVSNDPKELWNIGPSSVWLGRVIGQINVAYAKSVAQYPNVKPGADAP